VDDVDLMKWNLFILNLTMTTDTISEKTTVSLNLNINQTSPDFLSISEDFMYVLPDDELIISIGSEGVFDSLCSE
jgi:hypothetical protein